jgi:hypothetical protein
VPSGPLPAPLAYFAFPQTWPHPPFSSSIVAAATLPTAFYDEGVSPASLLIQISAPRNSFRPPPMPLIHSKRRAASLPQVSLQSDARKQLLFLDIYLTNIGGSPQFFS